MQAAEGERGDAPWRWTATGAAGAPAPARPGNPRVRAAAQAAVAAGVGLLLWRAWDRRAAAVVAWTIGGAVLALGLAAPAAFAAFERGARRFGAAAGAVLTWALLAPFYLAVFSLGHLGLKLRGRDPLGRLVPTDLPTYWVPRPRAPDPRRQF